METFVSLINAKEICNGIIVFYKQGCNNKNVLSIDKIIALCSMIMNLIISLALAHAIGHRTNDRW